MAKERPARHTARCLRSAAPWRVAGRSCSRRIAGSSIRALDPQLRS